MSYKPMVLVSGEWVGNGLRFATKEEALQNASDLMQRWMQVADVAAHESDEPAKHTYFAQKLEYLEETK